MTEKIRATYSVKARGYSPTLEFPNGGRQVSRSLYSSADEAQREANRCLKMRLERPECCIPDPAPHTYVEM